MATISGPGASRQQQIAYYSQYLAKLPGTYQGNYKQYDGMTWAALYRSLANSNPNADPKQLADAVLGVEAAQRAGGNVQAAGNGLGQFVTQTKAAAASTNFAAGVPGVSGLAAIGDFFSRLGESATWIRVAKVIIGGALLIIGLSHLTGADNAVANAARRVPLPI